MRVKKYENYCGEECRVAARIDYSKAYFSDEVKKAELALRRKLRSTPERRALRATRRKERHDRYAAFIANHERRVTRQYPDALTVDFTASDLEARMSMFAHRCWLCGSSFEAIDHVKPLSAGGAHMLGNLRPICQECNGRKHAVWPLSAVMRKFALWKELVMTQTRENAA